MSLQLLNTAMVSTDRFNTSAKCFSIRKHRDKCFSTRRGKKIEVCVNCEKSIIKYIVKILATSRSF